MKQICIFSGKYCYSYREARTIISQAHRKGSRDKHIPKREYWCEHCKSYHVTSNTSRLKYYK